MLEIKQLQFFRACVEAGSFSRAAELLYTSQPNVSLIIREMEKELGLTLFNRGGRGIEPNENGRILYQYAVDMLKKEEAITKLMTSRSHEILRVEYNRSRSMSEIISTYQRKIHSDFDMYVMESSTENVVEDLTKFKTDLGFCYILDKQMPAFMYNLERRKLRFEILKYLPLCVAYGKDNKAGFGEKVNLKDLEKVRFVRDNEDFFSLESGLCFGEPGLLPIFDRATISNSSQLIINLMIYSGFCNICVPTMGKTELHDNIRIALLDPEIKVNYVCIYRELNNERADDFLTYLKTKV